MLPPLPPSAVPAKPLLPEHLADLHPSCQKFPDPIAGACGSNPLFQKSLAALLSILMARDPYTLQHSHRVTRIAWQFGHFLKLPEVDLEVLQSANILHDLGKIGIKDSILFKPASLTAEERRVIQTHPQIGVGLVEDLELKPRETEIILHHHERWDGRGYPYGLAGTEIPLLCRTSALADVFDALTTWRPYRGPFTLAEALAEISAQAGKQFDPELTPIFVDMITRQYLSKNHFFTDHPRLPLAPAQVKGAARNNANPRLSRGQVTALLRR